MQIRFMFDTEKDDCTGLRALLGAYADKKVTNRRTKKKAGEMDSIRKSLDKLPAYMNVKYLKTEEAAEILVYANRIRSWLEELGEKVKHAIENGEDVKGWKLVEGSKKRCVIDNKAAIDALEKIGLTYDEIIEKYVTFSIPQLEKDLGKKVITEAFKNNIEKPTGDHILVPETDKRLAIYFEKEK